VIFTCPPTLVLLEKQKGLSHETTPISKIERRKVVFQN